MSEQKINFKSVSDIQSKLELGYAKASRIQEAFEQLDQEREDAKLSDASHKHHCLLCVEEISRLKKELESSKEQEACPCGYMKFKGRICTKCGGFGKSER